MKKLIIILIVSLCISNVSKAQSDFVLQEESQTVLTTSVFLDYSMLEVEFFKNGEGELKSKNIGSYVMGLNSTLSLSQHIDLVGAVGLSKGFDYRFASTNLAFKLSPSFNLNLGCGLYMIDDERWQPQGLDGQDPSNKDFGLNFGLACQLTDKLGISVRYNIIEEKEDYENGSMSINGLSFGIILK